MTATNGLTMLWDAMIEASEEELVEEMTSHLTEEISERLYREMEGQSEETISARINELVMERVNAQIKEARDTIAMGAVGKIAIFCFYLAMVMHDADSRARVENLLGVVKELEVTAADLSDDETTAKFVRAFRDAAGLSEAQMSGVSARPH